MEPNLRLKALLLNPSKRRRGNIPASNDAMREIAKALRRHVDAATLEKIVNELLDVRGNRDFREAIEELARELMRR
jgi:proline dehydrogenase